jgi:hypothetical protein
MFTITGNHRWTLTLSNYLTRIYFNIIVCVKLGFQIGFFPLLHSIDQRGSKVSLPERFRLKSCPASLRYSLCFIFLGLLLNLEVGDVEFQRAEWRCSTKNKTA